MEPTENRKLYPDLKEASKFHQSRKNDWDIHKGIETFLQQVTTKYKA